MNVTLIDYGAGNVTSVARAFRELGAAVAVSRQPAEIAAAEMLVLPGVGHCGALIGALDSFALRQPILEAISRGVPFLGICLGLQALYESSEEASDLTGLGLLQGRVTLLPEKVKLPHMGWNQVRRTQPSRLLDGIAGESYFYFAHSYAAPDSGPGMSAACHHGRDFVAVLERENLFGVQFHPEKSGAPGRALLRNFLGCAA